MTWRGDASNAHYTVESSIEGCFIDMPRELASRYARMVERGAGEIVFEIPGAIVTSAIGLACARGIVGLAHSLRAEAECHGIEVKLVGERATVLPPTERRPAPIRPGQVAILFGGSLGIGHALVRALAQRGVRVVACARNRARLEASIAGLPEVQARAVDVCDRDAVARVVEETAATLGRVDYVVNNAGVGVIGDFRDVQAEDWRASVEVNLLGALAGMRAAEEPMSRAGGGQIVNVASLSGLLPMPMSTPYTATKFAVVGLSRFERARLAAQGIRVNVVCPASVETPMFETVTVRGFTREAFRRALPDRPITAERCAAQIVRGMERDDAVITPGAAKMLWFLERNLTFVTRKLGRVARDRLMPLRQS